MIKISARADFGDVFAMLVRLPDQLQDKAVNMALNKVADKARTEMAKGITAEFNIKSSEVKSQISVSKASKSGNNMRVSLQAFGKRKGHRSLNVISFAAKQSKVGVSLKIKKSGGRKTITHAFIGNQGRTVFIRQSKGRLPIKAVETIDVPQMFNTKRINKQVIARIQAELPVEMGRAIDLVLSRMK